MSEEIDQTLHQTVSFLSLETSTIYAISQLRRVRCCSLLLQVRPVCPTMTKPFRNFRVSRVSQRASTGQSGIRRCRILLTPAKGRILANFAPIVQSNIDQTQFQAYYQLKLRKLGHTPQFWTSRRSKSIAAPRNCRHRRYNCATSSQCFHMLKTR